MAHFVSALTFCVSFTYFIFSSWRNSNSCCICCMLSGGSRHKSQNDGVRDNYGELPATRGQGQLLSHGDLKSCCYLWGHRLSYWGDWTTWPGSIRHISPNPLVLFPLDGWIVCRECTGKLIFFSLNLSSKVSYLRVYLRKKICRYIHILRIVALPWADLVQSYVKVLLSASPVV